MYSQKQSSLKHYWFIVAVIGMLLTTACTQYKATKRVNTVVPSAEPVVIIATGCRIESDVLSRYYSQQKSFREAKLAGRFAADYLRANGYSVEQVKIPFACYNENNSEQLALLVKLDTREQTIPAEKFSFPLAIDQTLTEIEQSDLQVVLDCLSRLPRQGQASDSSASCVNDLSARQMALLKRYTNNAQFIVLVDYKIKEFTKASTALKILIPIGKPSSKSRTMNAKLVNLSNQTTVWSGQGRPETKNRNVYFDKKNECNWDDDEPSEVRTTFSSLVCAK